MKGTWTSLEQAIGDIYELGHELASKEVVLPALKEIAEPLREDIVRMAPRSKDSEHMADTFVVVENEGQVLVGPHTQKGSVGWIAPFVEFGTSKMGARPFIRPSYDAWKRGFLAAFVAAARPRFEGVLRRRRKGTA